MNIRFRTKDPCLRIEVTFLSFFPVTSVGRVEDFKAFCLSLLSGTFLVMQEVTVSFKGQHSVPQSSDGYKSSNYIAIHGKLVVFRSLYCNVLKLSGSIASVQGFLTHQAAGPITQLLLANVIAWQIISPRW